jgi:8-oxo-dGTP pyrophosphatase MutT (NUDIX family)
MSTETAKRELYEETGGLVASPEVLPAAVWEPNGRYVTYVVHLKARITPSPPLLSTSPHPTLAPRLNGSCECQIISSPSRLFALAHS